jgi:cellulose biosynthesis protein BcsQ
MGEPITTYAPNSPGTEDYRALAKEIIEQEGVRSYGKAANE